MLASGWKTDQWKFNNAICQSYSLLSDSAMVPINKGEEQN